MDTSTQLRDRYRAPARGLVPLAVAGLVTATPVVTWWVVGDQTTTSPGTELDYLVRPVELDPAALRLVGIGSVLTFTGAALLLVWASRRRRFDPRWWSAIVPMVVAGAVVGAGWRVMTAGVVGANIGAGLVLLFGGPVVAALLLWTGFRSLYLLRSARRETT
jgi:hypothetical protein